jgi:hypothetical protein
MKYYPTLKRTSESGAALLIAIFALLLISVIAIALVVSSGTDSALASNYRTSSGAYYAALAGLEEARGRLLPKNPSPVTPLWGLTQVFYIVNPAAGETVDPTSTDPTNYPDTEYPIEFGWPLSGANVTQVASVPTVPGLPTPAYKWVRITPATEKSLNVDVDADGTLDPAAVLYYDPANMDTSKVPSVFRPGLTPNLTPTAVQAYEITALSVLPSGSTRMLQYVVAPWIIPSITGSGSGPFPAALTLLGTGATFQDAGAPGYKIDGRDSCSTTNPQAAVQSIAYTNALDYAHINAQVVPNQSNYPGFPMVPSGPPPAPYVPTTPSISTSPIIPSPAWQTPATLDAVVQEIEGSADVVINKPSATGTDISTNAPMMSSTNPVTIVVNGDLNLNAWHNTGYGLLLVTGTLQYDPDATWNGAVLVIGQGVFSSSKNGSGGINGAVVVARTRDSSGNLLPVLGAPFFGSQTSYGSVPGFGIVYGSCAGQGVAGQSATGPLTYKVLSFHEILKTN